jgi:hypothetical protein
MRFSIGKTSIIAGVFGAAAALAAFSCGISQPKYIDYDPESATETTVATGTDTTTDSSTTTDPDGAAEAGDAGETAECAAARTTFETTIQPKVVASCAIAGCHAVQPISGTALSATDAAVNRAQLKAYAAGAAETLFNKLSGSSVSHGGGDQSAALPLADISAWIEQEAACP